MKLTLTIFADTDMDLHRALMIAAAAILTGDNSYDSDSAESSITYEIHEELAPAEVAGGA